MFYRLITLLLISSSSLLNAQLTRDKYLPKNFVFIKGDSISGDFYISNSMVTNYEYKIYLNWVKRVYWPDYRPLETLVLPDTSKIICVKDCNAQISIGKYLFSTEYENYPVVGVNHIQASWYTHWYTDRLNEYIMFKEGVLGSIDSTQISENNFTTESYLAEQYMGTTIYNVLVKRFGGAYQFPDWETGMYYFSFRLPTEYELKIAMKTLVSQEKMNTYDKKYFLNNWAFKKSKKIEMMKGTSIEEWTLDNFEEKMQTLGYFDLLKAQGNTVYDLIDSGLISKNYIGRMPWYIIGETTKMQPICVENPYYAYYPWEFENMPLYFEFKTVRNINTPDSERIPVKETNSGLIGFRLVIGKNK